MPVRRGRFTGHLMIVTNTIRVSRLIHYALLPVREKAGEHSTKLVSHIRQIDSSRIRHVKTGEQRYAEKVIVKGIVDTIGR
jgi:hypothetical protein